MLPDIEVVRLGTSHEHGTFSAVKVNKQVICWGLEPYDYGNIPSHSCVPEGQYVCKRKRSGLVSRITSGRIVDTFEASHVPGRSFIRFHPGNINDDTEGCILLGDTLSKLTDHGRAILNSGETFKQFMAALDEYDQFVLTISSSY